MRILVCVSVYRQPTASNNENSSLCDKQYNDNEVIMTRLMYVLVYRWQTANNYSIFFSCISLIMRVLYVLVSKWQTANNHESFFFVF